MISGTPQQSLGVRSPSEMHSEKIYAVQFIKYLAPNSLQENQQQQQQQPLHFDTERSPDIGCSVSLQGIPAKPPVGRPGGGFVDPKNSIPSRV